MKETKGYTHINWRTLTEQYFKAWERGYQVVRVPAGMEEFCRVGTRRCKTCNPETSHPNDPQHRLANLLDNMKQMQEAHNELLTAMLTEMDELNEEIEEIARAKGAEG